MSRWYSTRSVGRTRRPSIWRRVRLCVLASRHRHACVVVCRAGIAELLDEHPSTEPVQLGVTVKFPDGWEAMQSTWAQWSNHRVSWRP